ncbi:undecaprenyl diphosphate synthase family protein [Streptomyces sp. NPDC005752]|uniref:undecaprenyl diphosphate synthase family protein n=1 Tax=Streptomyces sp. NPDC005752 TaxID=3157065 RepID=UPI00341006BE
MSALRQTEYVTRHRTDSEHVHRLRRAQPNHPSRACPRPPSDRRNHWPRRHPPPPDLLIRTGGEQRTSNFPPW